MIKVYRLLIFHQEFVDDYNDFTSKIADLDRRLASVLCQAFDDSCGTLGILKVTDCRNENCVPLIQFDICILLFHYITQ